MAEFSEVVKQARRLCEYYEGCRGCPLSRDKTGEVSNSLCRTITSIDAQNAIEIERIVTEWAKEHPEPTYPSWEDGWKSLFPDADCPCPNDCFGEECPTDMDCTGCVKRPMSKRVAEKLGIKPITTGKVVPEHVGCEGCRWEDRDEDEEPCMRCRNTQLVASARWIEMPDLWEKG